MESRTTFSTSAPARKRAKVVEGSDSKETESLVEEQRKHHGALGVTGMGSRSSRLGYSMTHGVALMTEESVYGELRLQEASQSIAGVRVRQQVNPLKARFQTQAPTPLWATCFVDLNKALTVDVGCGGGRFDLLYAKRNPGLNVLGIDIREALVNRGSKWSEVAGVQKNLHFAACNATVSAGNWIKSYNECDAGSGKVELVCAQFCDPHFKKKHRKRRIVQQGFVEQLARELTPGARVFLQSDVQELAEDMRNQFERFCGAHFHLDPGLHKSADTLPCSANGAPTAATDAGTGSVESGDKWRSSWARAGWLEENPIGVPTEREVQTLGEGLPVFRVMLQRNGIPYPQQHNT